MIDFIVKMNSNITELEIEVLLASISLVRLDYCFILNVYPLSLTEADNNTPTQGNYAAYLCSVELQ